MPKYVFHIREDGVLDRDEDGIDLPNADVAYKEAINAAREMLAEKVLKGDVIDGQRFELTTEDGILLCEVPFRALLRLD
jgi:hypothetical protein